MFSLRPAKKKQKLLDIVTFRGGNGKPGFVSGSNIMDQTSVNSHLTGPLLEKLCPKQKVAAQSAAVPKYRYHSILLIIVFNTPHYKAIPYLEILYRDAFPNILYCGPGQPNATSFDGEYTFSFMSYGETRVPFWDGAFNYECVTMAMRHFGRNYLGYLLVADDVMFNFWNIANLDFHHAWYVNKICGQIGDVRTGKLCKDGECNILSDWMWFRKNRKGNLNAINVLYDKATHSIVARNCVKQLKRLNQGEFRINGGPADIYYIPSWLTEFITVGEIFRKAELWLELAVPTMIRCLERPEKIQSLTGEFIWDKTREMPWLHFSKHKDSAYFHPSKLGPIAQKSEEHRKYFCDSVLPEMYKNLKR